MLLFGGCEVNREVVVDPYNKLPTLKRVVVEGPGGDMVGVEVEIVRRLDPLLPEPWNTIISIVLGALVYAILVRSFWTKTEEPK
tara:strand:+ start:7670 stop:7921 length:252 start_codon:yes stop_codon:yes gene_type:complete